MALNTVIPIRPRDTSSGSDFSNKWLEWLTKVGAYSDLADSVPYRYMNQNQLNTTPVSIPYDNRLGNILEGGETLKKVAPRAALQIKGRVDSNLPVEGKFSNWLDRTKPGAKPSKHVTVRDGVHDTSTWKHEVQHAIQDKVTSPKDLFYDRQINKALPREAVLQTPTEDVYYRSQDEILANHAMRDEHPGAPPPVEVQNTYLGKGKTNSPEMRAWIDKPFIPEPKRRVIELSPKFMQNLRGITGGALGAVGGMLDVTNTVQGLQDIKNRGGGWIAPAKPHLPEGYE